MKIYDILLEEIYQGKGGVEVVWKLCQEELSYRKQLSPDILNRKEFNIEH